MKSNIYRVLIGISKPISEWITGKRYRIRFQMKEEREYQKILDFLNDHPGFLQESHKPTKLVTPNHRADNPLDPLCYPLPYTEKENRMDTPPRPPRLRKPPLENVEYFFVHPLNVDDERIHIKRNRGNGTALCGKAVVWGECIDPEKLSDHPEICNECVELHEYNLSLHRSPPKENPAPDWDKIKKLAQRMNGLVDEIEKEINDGNEKEATEGYSQIGAGAEGDSGRPGNPDHVPSGWNVTSAED